VLRSEIIAQIVKPFTQNGFDGTAKRPFRPFCLTDFLQIKSKSSLYIPRDLFLAARHARKRLVIHPSAGGWKCGILGG
jgi:hypothetical protein